MQTIIDNDITLIRIHINGKLAIFNDVVRDKNHEGITKHLNNGDKLAGENIYLAHTHNVF